MNSTKQLGLWCVVSRIGEPVPNSTAVGRTQALARASAELHLDANALEDCGFKTMPVNVDAMEAWVRF